MIPLDGSFTIADVRAVADGEPMRLTDDAREQMRRSCAAVDDIIDGDDVSVCGVRTWCDD